MAMTAEEKRALVAAPTPAKTAMTAEQKRALVAAPTPAKTAPAQPSIGGDLGSWATESNRQLQNLLASQKAEQEALFKKYETVAGGQETMTGAYGRLSAEAGVPELQKQLEVYKGEIYKVKDLLDRLDENVTARTEGTFTTEAQRARQVAAEGEPLQRTLGRLGTAMAPIGERLTAAQMNVATILGYKSADDLKALQPTIMRIETISDRFSREITGYTTQKQNELTALMDKLTRDRELADREWQQAEQLAAEEREWARTKEQIAIEQANKIKQIGYSASVSTTAEDKASEKSFNEAYNWAKSQYSNYASMKNEPWWTENVFKKKLYEKYGAKLDTEQLDYILYEARRDIWGT